jgi:hypothetical protein
VPGAIPLGHFLVNNPAAGGHPLHVAAADQALVAQTVPVLYRPPQNIRDGLDATVRMPWEALQVLSGIVGPEIVEEQEGSNAGTSLKPKARLKREGRCAKSLMSRLRPRQPV